MTFKCFPSSWISFDFPLTTLLVFQPRQCLKEKKKQTSTMVRRVSSFNLRDVCEGFRLVAEVSDSDEAVIGSDEVGQALSLSSTCKLSLAGPPLLFISQRSGFLSHPSLHSKPFLIYSTYYPCWNRILFMNKMKKKLYTEIISLLLCRNRPDRSAWFVDRRHRVLATDPLPRQERNGLALASCLLHTKYTRTVALMHQCHNERPFTNQAKSTH